MQEDVVEFETQINEEVKKTSDNKSKRTIINIFIFLIIVTILFFYYAKNIATSDILIKEYRIENQNLPVNFSGLKIVHFSDLLYKSTVDLNDIKKIVDKINLTKPDIVIFTGGLVKEDSKLKEDEKNNLKEELSKIKSKLGKYAIKGNEDYNDYYEDIITSSDFVLLNNSYELVYNEGLTPIFIGGLPSMIKEDVKIDEMFSYYKDNEINENKAHYKIVLVHEGNIIPSLLQADIETDLILGGHSLNGSINLPIYGPLFIPKESSKYYKEYYKEANTTIYISSGIGTNKYEIRFNNRPSFNLYRLKSI